MALPQPGEGRSKTRIRLMKFRRFGVRWTVENRQKATSACRRPECAGPQPGLWRGCRQLALRGADHDSHGFLAIFNLTGFRALHCHNHPHSGVVYLGYNPNYTCQAQNPLPFLVQIQ